MGRVDESQLQDASAYREPDIQDVIEQLHGRYGGNLEQGQKFLRIVQLEFKYNNRTMVLKPDLVEGMKELGIRMICDLYVTLHIQASYLTWRERLSRIFRPGKGRTFRSLSGDTFEMTGTHGLQLMQDQTFMSILKALLRKGSRLATKNNTISLLNAVYSEGDVEKLEQAAVRLENLVKR